ncbi:MAG: hypothetical protein R3338_14425, partial [Thermoanaerobaculia bacterium]|nr:hypothetical protein [Thermoanaerobaculia bacterium]
ILDALAPKNRKIAAEILEAARLEGLSESRGEDDAGILADMIQDGGAPGAVLLVKTGELPEEAPVLDKLERDGGLLRCDLTRESFPEAFGQAVAEVSEDYEVHFEQGSIRLLEEKLGIRRVLEDKYSSEIPDLSLAVSEAIRLAAHAGKGGVVTREAVEFEIRSRAGGRRYEFASLFSEGKTLEALEKLRDLVAQGKREDPRLTSDLLYGRYLFSLAEEIRTLIAVHSFCRSSGLRPGRRMGFNQFKGELAGRMGTFFQERRITRKKLHPFVLYKKYEAAGRYSEKMLLRSLQRISEIEIERKSGGVPPSVSMEALLLSIDSYVAATDGR